MSKIPNIAIILANVLTLIVSILAMTTLVTLCKYGVLPYDWDMSYGAALIGWLFCMILTFYLDINYIKKK